MATTNAAASFALLCRCSERASDSGSSLLSLAGHSYLDVAKISNIGGLSNTFRPLCGSGAFPGVVYACASFPDASIDADTSGPRISDANSGLICTERNSTVSTSCIKVFLSDTNFLGGRDGENEPRCGNRRLRLPDLRCGNGRFHSLRYRHGDGGGRESAWLARGLGCLSSIAGIDKRLCGGEVGIRQCCV